MNVTGRRALAVIRTADLGLRRCFTRGPRSNPARPVAVGSASSGPSRAVIVVQPSCPRLATGLVTALLRGVVEDEAARYSTTSAGPGEATGSVGSFWRASGAFPAPDGTGIAERRQGNAMPANPTPGAAVNGNPTRKTSGVQSVTFSRDRARSSF